MANLFTIADGGLGGLGFRGRAKRCKYGRKANGRCRKTPRKGASGKAHCKHGKLKHPRGRRICKKR